MIWRSIITAITVTMMTVSGCGHSDTPQDPEKYELCADEATSSVRFACINNDMQCASPEASERGSEAADAGYNALLEWCRSDVPAENGVRDRCLYKAKQCEQYW